jgi:hypothetical protein
MKEGKRFFSVFRFILLYIPIVVCCVEERKLAPVAY